jgi:Fe-S-cluster containining protein
MACAICYLYFVICYFSFNVFFCGLRVLCGKIDAVSNDNKNYWYAAGLHFGCLGCGRCCSGPAEGYIWVSRPEIRLIAEYLNISTREMKTKYLRRVGFRRSLIEDMETYDCIFLRDNGKGKTCSIYPVRPAQCRSWPFWSVNLAGPYDWNTAGRKCPGINRGSLYDIEQIRVIKSNPKWWRE